MKATSIVLVLMLLFSGVCVRGQEAAPTGGAPASVVETQPTQNEPAAEVVEAAEDEEAEATESEEENSGTITIEDIMVRGLKMFMGGVPMKPATKVFAGLS